LFIAIINFEPENTKSTQIRVFLRQLIPKFYVKRSTLFNIRLTVRNM
jgi:hypothetical protein